MGLKEPSDRDVCLLLSIDLTRSDSFVVLVYHGDAVGLDGLLDQRLIQILGLE